MATSTSYALTATEVTEMSRQYEALTHQTLMNNVNRITDAYMSGGLLGPVPSHTFLGRNQFDQSTRQKAMEVLSQMGVDVLNRQDYAIRSEPEITIPDLPRPSVAPARPVPGDYATLAKSLGFRPYELVLTELGNAVADLGLPCYDPAAVSEYLTARKRRARATVWCWRPLREADRMQTNIVGAGGSSVSSDGNYLYTTSGTGLHCSVYDKLVPRRALERVAAVAKRMGNDVAFFVSDFASPKIPDPDPFVMVAVRGARPVGLAHPGLFVFDVWNEPGFDSPPAEG